MSSLKPGKSVHNKLMKQLKLVPALLAAAAGVILNSQAAFVVNDTWIDGTRTDPASTTDSENGVDTDLDGNIESRWANAGGTMSVINAVAAAREAGRKFITVASEVLGEAAA